MNNGKIDKTIVINDMYIVDKFKDNTITLKELLSLRNKILKN